MRNSPPHGVCGTRPPTCSSLSLTWKRYPEFVPLCSSLKVRRRIEEPEGVLILVADMTVAYKLIHESFVSRVTLDRPNLQILVEYLDGPFSHLENRWTFRPTGERTCEVSFFISYEFKSRMLGMLMGSMFDLAFRRFAAAFEAARGPRYMGV